MEFAIPIYYAGGVYIGAELRKPSGKLLADAQEAFASQTAFHGIHELITGSVRHYIDADGEQEDNRGKIGTITRYMPYRAAEPVALDIMAQLNGDDVIIQEYTCPRCRKSHAPVNDGEIDERPRLSDMPRKSMEEIPAAEPLINIDLDDPIEIKSRGDVLKSIQQIAMRYPTINDCIQGSLRVPAEAKTVRRQYAIYGASILAINGSPVDEVFRKTWGQMLFERMPMDDLRGVSERVQEYGMDPLIERICPHCGHKFRAPVDTSNFFESGLRGI